MHYKNGTPAQEGDAVILKRWNGRVVAGTLHTTQPSSTACNGQVAIPVPGGVVNDCVTIGEIYSAEDAFAALEALQPKAEPAPEPEPPECVAAPQS